MREDLDKKLCECFPNLYADRHANAQETCMCWGFPGDGWYELLWELSAKLESMICKLPDGEREQYRAFQVKEKFGTLRYYMTKSTKEMDEAITEAEEKSAHTCESCGAPGTTRSGGWVRVLCDPCSTKK